MTFDIHQPVYDPKYGDYDEDAGSKYEDELVALFAESPEGRAVIYEQGITENWTWVFLDYAISHVGATPPDMTLRDVDEVLFELFPRKVSTEAESAANIVTELRAFWTFLGREFSLPNAPTIIRRLDDAAIPRLKRLLADPSMYGMAKSMVMMGIARGFDPTSEADMNAWMHTYNSELLLKGSSKLGLPGSDLSLPAPLELPRSTQTPAKRTADKKRRQMAKASRKQNRRR